jgi:hypothetical protein
VPDQFIVRDTGTRYQACAVDQVEAQAVGCPDATHKIVGRYTTTYGTFTATGTQPRSPVRVRGQRNGRGIRVLFVDAVPIEHCDKPLVIDRDTSTTELPCTRICEDGMTPNSPDTASNPAPGAEDLAGAAGPELRTPDEWSSEEGILVMDDDGWRADGKPWDVPITLAEFNERASISSCLFQQVPARVQSRFPADAEIGVRDPARKIVTEPLPPSPAPVPIVPQASLPLTPEALAQDPRFPESGALSEALEAQLGNWSTGQLWDAAMDLWKAAQPTPAAKPEEVHYERSEAIQLIRGALRERSGKAWSVRGGRGSVWAWIFITALPSRRDQDGAMTADDQAELAALLDLDQRLVGRGGVSISGGGTRYRTEYVARAQGEVPSVFGTPIDD